MKEQNKSIRLILEWLDECPCEAIISSMAGHLIHIKVDSSNVIKIKKIKEEKNNETI